MDHGSSFKLVVGLGNPGYEYAETRHNIGFMITNRLLGLLPGSFEETKACSGICWKGRLGGRSLYVLNPMTYMNLSGKSVAALAESNGISVEEIIVVYDDVDFPLGKIKFRKGGSSAGHRGIESMIAELKSASFARMRIGIDSIHRKDQVDFVLGKFAMDEQQVLERVLETSAEALKLALHRGLGKAMNGFNGIDLAQEMEENKE